MNYIGCIMPGYQCLRMKSYKIISIVAKIRAIFLFTATFLFPLCAFAGAYVGGSFLVQPVPYHPFSTNYIKLGSSKLYELANGISLNAGYRFQINKYSLASEIDLGTFTDADGNLTYAALKHYVSASYYLALKEKFGFYVVPNSMLYGLLGLSENSIGDRIFSTAAYFNKKQISFIYGAGLEYYTQRDSKVALFVEGFYFTPTNMTLYSGGAKPPSAYTLSTGGLVLQLGMRYYFE